jgi:phospholipid-binding lipoprotein MlaA
MTLALWGVPPGPYLFIPVLGPSDPRDLVGFWVDIADWPFTWIGNGTTVYALEWAYYGMTAIDTRERVLDTLDQMQKTALDPYATVRSLYRQHRQSQIDAIRNDHRATIPAWFPEPAAKGGS